MKNLILLLGVLFTMTLFSCEKSNGVVPKDLKKMVINDLKGKVFIAYEAEFSKESGNVKVDPSKGFFTKMEFIGNVIEFTNSSNNKSRYGFEINNGNRNLEELPEVYTIPMKSNYKNFYVYLNSDYSNAFVTLTEGNVTYKINLKL